MQKRSKTFTEQSYSKARNYDVVPDTITYYDLPNQLTVYGQRRRQRKAAKPARWPTPPILKHGTNIRHSCAATTVILFLEGSGTGSILIIKDSYANAFIPLSRRGLRLYRDCGLPLSQ